MSIWRDIKFNVGRVGFYTYQRLGLYGLWSKAYRWLYNRQYRDTTLSTYTSFQKLEQARRVLIWKADGPKELWDAIASPEYVEYVLRIRPDKHVGDCDEFAIYNVATLNGSVAAGVFDDKTFQHASLLSIGWLDKEGKFNGHNVALLTFEVAGVSVYSYVDYGMPSERRHTVRQVVQDVLDHYVPGATLIGYAVNSEVLHPGIVEVGP
jgi:hypothetical protein